MDNNSGNLTRRYYDVESERYDQLRWQNKSGKARDEWQYHALTSLLGSVINDTVLEIGCGTGRMTFRLLFQCGRLIALDFSSKMLTLAKGKTRDPQSTLCLLLANACQLPLSNEGIDAVLLVNTLQLIKSPEKLFSEIRRVLKPAGRLIFNYPNLSSIFLPYGLYRNWSGRARTRNKAGYRRTNWFSRAWLQKTLEEKGLRVVEGMGQPGMNPSHSILKTYPQFFCPSVFLKAVKTH